MLNHNIRRGVLWGVALLSILGLYSPVAVRAAYEGQVSANVPRDRIMAIAEDYATLSWYCGDANLTARTGAEFFYTGPGWQTGMAYCWGGEDSPVQYLARIAAGAGAGNIDTSSGSSTDATCTGADCSGFVSNAWTSARKATSGFSSISVQIAWENLRRGDATNNAGSHIRLFDHFVGDIDTLMLYESTSGSGLLWRNVHRSLARDTVNYVPIRYQSTYKAITWAEPEITYARKAGLERIQIRWDGQADTGFRVYQSADGINFIQIRDETALPLTARTCDISGLLPDATYFFRVTSVNSTGETGPSETAAVRLGEGAARVLLVAAYDRQRTQFSKWGDYSAAAGASLGRLGLAFDYSANEGVMDEQVSLSDYQAAVWLNGQEATLDETFSWAEQYHAQNFLNGGGRLFASGSEIAYDIVSKANTAASYKNGHVNDAAFATNYLGIGFANDTAGTKRAVGEAGSIFAGLDLTFGDGTGGTYTVDSPDVFTALGGSTAALRYSGGVGGIAGVVRSSADKGKAVVLGFPFESINSANSRDAAARAVFQFFAPTLDAPKLKEARAQSPTTALLKWDGWGENGFRLYEREGAGAWMLIADESSLGPQSHEMLAEDLTPGARYAYKIQAVGAVGAGPESNVLVLSPGALDAESSILLVDGFDRWASLGGGQADALLDLYAQSLDGRGIRFDSCLNEQIAQGAAALAPYCAVFWMLGEESSESETFSAAEQEAVKTYLKAGGRLLASGAEIGWDLSARGGSANNYSNGSAGDAAFFADFLKAGYVRDSAGVSTAKGRTGGLFEGLTFSFSSTAQGSPYAVEYPDVITAAGGSAAVLDYGTGSEAAGVSYAGLFPGGSSEGRLIYLAFPFETIAPAATRMEAMSRVLDFFSLSAAQGKASGLICY